jgi:hypothetical protein
MNSNVLRVPGLSRFELSRRYRAPIVLATKIIRMSAIAPAMAPTSSIIPG